MGTQIRFISILLFALYASNVLGLDSIIFFVKD